MTFARSWWARTLAALGAVMVAALLPALPAHAHPDPEAPQEIEATAVQNVVELRWRAASDDRATLAYVLGVVPASRTFVFERGVMVEADASDDELLAAAPDQLGDYLLERLAVRSGGESCEGRLVAAAEVASAGARLEFDCPAPVSSAEVSVTTLRDLDPGYETAVVVDSVPLARYTADIETMVLAFGEDGRVVAAEPMRGFDPAVPIAILAAVLLLATAGIVLVRRRRTHRAGTGSPVVHRS